MAREPPFDSDEMIPGSGDVTARIHAADLHMSEHSRAPARLLMLMGPEPGRRFGLDKDAVVIGRAEECEVRIDDGKVSRQHARIGRQEDGGWYVEDLGSRNGTIVNGQQVRVRTLEVGDRIQLSQQILLLFTRADPLEDLLQHRQQMEVIGQLAAGIAHDFNNLLNVIVASADHLADLPGETKIGEADVSECVSDVRTAAMRAADLTRKLLSIARRRGTVPLHEPVSIATLASDVLSLVRRTFGRSIRVESDVPADLFVTGDPAGLHQLLMNLCINGRDAMPDGGTLTVKARLELDPAPDPRSPWRAGSQVILSVRDTGIGMSEETRRRVFEPFFTTKERGAGSGLGLATVYEVATSHGGYVEVETELGAGSTFYVKLPAHVARSQRPTPRATIRQMGIAKPVPSPAHSLVLIVDDQDLVRRSLARLVRAGGHEVCLARDGAEALEAYTKSEKRPDLVLLDLDMPNLSGAECLKRLREIDPSVRVVLVSGYSDENRRRRLLDQGAVDFLPKPVDAAQLRDALGRALARKT